MKALLTVRLRLEGRWPDERQTRRLRARLGLRQGQKAGGPASRKVKRYSTMKTIDKPSSGACGDIIASRNHYGPYVRRRARAAKRPTAAQRSTQAENRAVAKAMEALTDEQIQAWVVDAEQVMSKPRLGKRFPLTWQVYFHKINNPRAGFGLPLLMDPPPRAQFGPNPVGRLIITNIGGRIALKLEVSRPPEADIMVFGAKPCKRTILKCFKCPRIGPLPAPVGGMSDVTRQYVKKHGKPGVGQRVFIRTRQYLDGGPEDRFEETSAVVPAKEARSGRAKEV